MPAKQPRSRTVRLDGHVARRAVGAVEKILWDSEHAGFGLRTQPTGHKTWDVKYEQHCRQIKVTLGVVGDLTAEAARRQARALLAKVATKGLPRPAVQRTAPTFEAYIEPFWACARHWTPPGTQTTNERLIDRELKPVFGTITLDRIKRSDVMCWRDDLSDRPGVFNRSLSVLAGMLAYAEQLDHRPPGSNPCRWTPRYRRVPNERFLSVAKYRWLGAVLASSSSDEPAAVAVIKLILLTGVRILEIAVVCRHRRRNGHPFNRLSAWGFSNIPSTARPKAPAMRYAGSNEGPGFSVLMAFTAWRETPRSLPS